ncbi:MAG: DNA polymerase I [Candidatus Hydrogenedentales bacterium]|jgi:DNA polymerase-1
MNTSFYLIDAMAFAFRAFHAISANLTDNQQRPTNAIFGFTRILLKILKEQKPDYIAVVFDAPGKTFRHELYPEYKANRAAAAPEFIEQIPRMHDVVCAMNLPLTLVPGVEADDAIGTLARAAEKQGHDVVIVSGDKDLLQLVSDKVHMMDPGKTKGPEKWTPAEVEERFGVGPKYVPDALALIGDSADNIPGVRLIGPVKAKKLLSEYGTLEELYAHVEEQKGKQREYLIEDREQAFFARSLITVKTDVEMDTDLDAYQRQAWDLDILADCFTELGFHSILEEISSDKPETEHPKNYALIHNREELRGLVEKLSQCDVFALDTETTHVQPMLADLVGISLSMEAGTAFYIPVNHGNGDLESLMTDTDDPEVSVTLQDVLDLLKPLFENPAIGKIGHNIKYDMIVLKRCGIDLQGVTMDTMLASYLTEPSRLRHNLDELSLHHLNHKAIPISDLLGKGAQARTFDQIPLNQAVEYACEDADLSLRLEHVFRPRLSELGLNGLLNEIEIPLIYVLAGMEMQGISIDANLFNRLHRELVENLSTLESKIHDLAGEAFNINSPKQLQHILYEKIGLTPLRKNKSGYSTDVDSLEALASEHPLPEAVLEYRSLEKLRGTYVEALPKLVNPQTGRIHTSFNQAVAATGRLSSSTPNLQNIPTRTDLGKQIREGFIASSPTKRLISADYSQIELRILAHLTGDETLRTAFASDADIHKETAARIFNVAPEAVTADMRRQAKAVNFGVIYGMGDFSLAKNTGLDRNQARAFIQQYFDTYPGVAKWLEEVKELCRKQGYVTTLMNRRRYIPDINSTRSMARAAAERVAINTPVQGSAADIIKIAMVRMYQALQAYPAQMLVQVHDELVVESEEACAEEVAALMRSIMCSAVELSVPLKVDTGIGFNWAEIH